MRTIKLIGLIVAILGLLTAMIALITEGIKLYLELPTATPQHQIVNGSTATPVKIVPPDGTWQGLVEQPNAPPYSAVLTLQGCNIGSFCGSIQYPEVACTSSLTYVGDTNGQYEFYETITAGKCVNGSLFLIQNTDVSWSLHWPAHNKIPDTYAALVKIK